MRTFDKDLIWKRMQEYRQEFEGFELNSWVDNPLNIALTDGQGSVAMFEWELPGVYSGHYFFRKHTRGKAAVKVSKEFLNEFFQLKPDATLIKGLTPMTHKGALWLSAHLGFQKYGIIKTPVGECMLFILQRKEFFNEQRLRRQ